MTSFRIVHMQGREESSFDFFFERTRRLLMKWDTLADAEEQEEQEEGRGKRVSESFRVQDQTEPPLEPALMWNLRTTREEEEEGMEEEEDFIWNPEGTIKKRMGVRI